MTRQKLYSVAIALILAVTVGNAVLTLINFQSVASTQARQTAASAALRSAQAQISAVQHHLLVSQKASTHTRVTTVAQRCQLTRLTAGVLVRRDPADAGAFQTSLAGCERQLALVKRIDAHTPAPR